MKLESRYAAKEVGEGALEGASGHQFGTAAVSNLPPIDRAALPLFHMAKRIVGEERVSLLFADIGYRLLSDLSIAKLVNVRKNLRGVVIPTLSGGEKLECTAVILDPETLKLLTFTTRPEIQASSPHGFVTDSSLVPPYRQAVKSILSISMRNLIQSADSFTYRPVGNGTWKRNDSLALRSLVDGHSRRDLIAEEFCIRLSDAREAALQQRDIHPLLSMDPENYRDIFIGKLCQIDAVIQAKTFRALGDVSDPKIFDELWTQSSFTSREFNFAVSASDPLAQLRRVRWAVTFREFFELAEDESLLEAIDCGESTLPLIAEYFGVESGVIKRLKSLSPTAHKALGARPVAELINIFSRSSVGQIPEFAKLDDGSLITIGSVLNSTVKLVSGVTQHVDLSRESVAQMTKNVGKNWQSTERHAECQKTAEIMDFVSVWSKRSFAPALFLISPELKKSKFNDVDLGLPGILPIDEGGEFERLKKISRGLLLLALSQYWHIGQFAQASERWHKTFGRGEGHQSHSDTLVTWLPLCAEVQAPNGCILVPLTSSAELSEEGNKMKHCVGSYSSDCMYGNSHIFSVRSAEGKRLSTLQVTSLFEGGKPRVFVSQNSAVSNGTPSGLASQASEWLCQSINSEKIVVAWEELTRAAKQALSSMRISQALGFDPFNTEQWEQAWKEFSVYAPHAYRSDDPREFVKKAVSGIELEQFRSTSSAEFLSLKRLKTR